MKGKIKELINKAYQFDHLDEIVGLRLNLLNFMYKVGIVLGSVSYIFSMVDFIYNGLYLNMVVVSIVYFSLLTAYFLNLLSNNVKKYFALFIFVILGIYLTMYGGMFTTGVLWLAAIPMIALIFLGIKWSYYSLIFIFFYSLLTIVIFSNNIVVWHYGFEYFNIFRWIGTVTDAVMIAALISFSLAIFIQKLGNSLLEEKKLKSILENELKEKDILIRNLEDRIEEVTKYENDLFLTNKRLDIAQNFGEVGLWEFNEEEKIFWFSDKAISILDLEKNKNFVERKDFFERINELDLNKIKEKFNNIGTSSEQFFLKFRIKSNSSDTKWILAIGQKIFDNNGFGTEYGSMRDISYDVATQEALQKSEFWFQNIFDNALDGLVIIKDYKFIQINKQLAHIFELNEEDLIGKFPWELSPEYQPDGNKSEQKAKYFLDKLNTDIETTFEWAHLRNMKYEFIVEVNLKKFNYENAQYSIAILRDISERKKYENQIKMLNSVLESKVKERTEQLNLTLEELKYENEERKRTQEELYKLQDELIYSLSKARELNNLKSKFIEMASHEYRTPLTAILSASYIIEILADKENQKDLLKNIGIIKSSVNDMTNLLDEIFEIERTDKLKYNPNISQIELNGYITSIVNETKAGYNFDGKVNLISSFTELVINTDVTALRSIIGKILNNSIKFSKDSPIINIELISYSDSIGITISDNGVGIPKNQLESIFDMFYKADNYKNKGAGLGLTIVKNYLDIIGGKISINSELNMGTTVNLIIPKQM